VTDTHVHDPVPAAETQSLDATTGGLPVISRGSTYDKSHFEAFGCKVRAANPATPDRVEPDIAFLRGVHGGATVRMADGRSVEFWSFHDLLDPANEKAFPAPLIRVREGQVVHTTLESSKNTHTIHHHGIEPTPHNDGVGHTSFEVKDVYTYQWRPAQAGTYFYHCHKNTVLHFELGMYGPIIVDPPEGPGFVRSGTGVVPYDREALWIADDVDPAWHTHINHSAGLVCPTDDSQPLLDFRPSYWILSGVASHRSRTDPRVAVTTRPGERLLVRLLNAAYGPVVVRLPFDATCISMDGHCLGGRGVDRYSRPFTIPAGAPIELTTAQRWDLLLVPDRTGTFTVPVDFKHWVRGTTAGRVETTITVNP
jgi:FtsP/CotA-like multicopper oxidase with cupredoxin domain